MLRDALFRQMLTIRVVEEALFELYSESLLHGTIHTCLGQENCAVGVVNALDRERDVVFSNHRGHGHFIAYCDDVEGLIAELLGRTTGVCGGLGGSQHLHRDNFYSNGIQGGIVPLATGAALGEKIKGSGAIATVFLGDGTHGEGVVYESFNIAALWKLPVLFVVEQNQYAQSTPAYMEHAGCLEARAVPFGIPVTVHDAGDVERLYEAALACASRVRSEKAPHLFFLRTYRLGPHSKGDDLRPLEELERHRDAEPLKRMRETLAAEFVQKVELEVRARVANAVAAARAAPLSDFMKLASGGS